MLIELKGLSKYFGKNKVLNNIDMAIDKGEFVSLVGPSGVGKTTLLKILADLEPFDSGIIHFSENPDKAHPVIMVFQDFSLFPHMNIAENVGYGLKIRGVVRAVRQEKTARILHLFGINEKAKNYPAHLSAGQKQRAAIARAMIIQPMVLLLDEPFANLDKNLKYETAQFIRKVQQSSGTTIVMVSHDRDEAFAVSDRIAVLMEGTIEQYDSPKTIAQAPANDKIAQFLGKEFLPSLIKKERKISDA